MISKQGKYIVILNGTGGSGKNTFADMVGKHIPMRHISMVDIVKDYIDMIGIQDEKDEHFRRFLSDIKLALEYYKDIPFQYVIIETNKFLEDSQTKILFIDMREPHDIERFEKNYLCTKVLVKNIHINDIMSNIADASIKDIYYDYIIDNNGTISDLEESAKTFIKDLYSFTK